jgi:proteasome lid subunit RPN8/RPN11
MARLAKDLAMTIVRVSALLIRHTVDTLQEASDVERVVLWLGRRDPGGTTVTEVFLPMQETDADYFRIPPQGMAALLAHLRDHRLMVAAQVHTHPDEAFHSAADDRWAIVSHVGGLSLVVPEFCQRTTESSFVSDTKVYRLVAAQKFHLVSPATVYEVLP